MGEKVGFFKQFIYAFRGIVKPKYYNRMASQKVFNIIVFVLVINFLSTSIFWGFKYLSLSTSDFARDLVNKLPEFHYSYGQLEIMEEFEVEDTERNKVYIADTSVEDAYNCSLYAVKTKAGWGNGKEIYVLTGNAMIGFDKVNGKETIYPYTDFYKFATVFFQIPEEFTIKDVKGIINANLWRVIAIVAAVAFLVNIFFSFTFIPLILAGIGFGLCKLLHGDYRFKELYFISIYIFCMASLLVTPFKLTFLPGKLVNGLSYIIMLVYLYFALTGSRIEISNASSIELGKKEPRFDDDLGFQGTGFAAPDPLEKRKPVSPYYSQTSKPAAPSYSSQPAPTPSVVVAEVPTPTVPKMEEYASQPSLGGSTYANSTSYSEPAYEETAYSEPVYDETTYSQPVYEETAYSQPVYEETAYSQPVYEETAYSESAYDTSSYDQSMYGEASYEEPAYQEPQSSSVFGGGMSANITSISGGIGGSTYSNSGGSYAGSVNTGGGVAVARSGAHIGGYHDPAYDMPQSFDSGGYASEPLPKLGAAYGGTFSVNDLNGGPIIGSSTFSNNGQSAFGGSAFGGSAFGSSSGSQLGGSTFGSSSYGGSSYGSSSYGGGSYGSSSYGGGNRFSRPKNEPMLRSTGSGSQADKDFEEWERLHYGNN